MVLHEELRVGFEEGGEGLGTGGGLEDVGFCDFGPGEGTDFGG